MGIIIGPTSWWQANLERSCPVGTTLPDGSIIFCKSGGNAWILAPTCTQISEIGWGSDTNCWTVDVPGSEMCCITQWGRIYNRLLFCGFNANDWFVPSYSQMQSIHCANGPLNNFFNLCFFSYWTSTEQSATTAQCVSFCNPNTLLVSSIFKCSPYRIVIPIRCVTY